MANGKRNFDRDKIPSLLSVRSSSGIKQPLEYRALSWLKFNSKTQGLHSLLRSMLKYSRISGPVTSVESQLAKILVA